ncbi:prolipoprotein diacylglyceryl transferase [Saccharomonospora amisosensis]|uniref:Phosphatidylglycerol--prolipoprotein diacylglyceryl transferase n=1 Tax=Saccharomonospora amisosensis TaxID=1128677 RepID=A0A7X5ZQB8_9PSEU|nr:prolipoprotein diacylglyceryl transferase [Saccharomonospora amisosensis]NIJ11155.1 prolipoprotein diacylglyceryl transferase [Saccharomonospora amisosensis]
MNTASAFFLANIPSPDRGVWFIGPVPLRAYALCIIAGILVAIWWGDRRWVQRGGTKGTIVDIAVYAVPFGLVGGRLYHVITDSQLYFGEGKDPLRVLYIWDGGLGIWGAIALGGVGAWLACKRRGIPLPAVADAIAPGIVAAQAIGRLGNYFNQELYGGPTDLPWGLEIYRRVDPENPLIQDSLDGVAINNVPIEVVHPTFLYELLWNLGVALLVVWADRRFRLGHGRAFALYVAGYTAGRFWIELMRTDPANEILGLRVNVWTSMLVFAGAVAYFVLARARGPREAPETLRGHAPGEREPEEERSEESPEPEGSQEDAGDSAGDEAAAGDKGQVERGK